ncbi:MAG: hypothetical protein PPP58_10890 [Natronomonas sp.]
MDSRRAAPTLGIVSSVVVVAVLAVPYSIVDSGAVSGYYNAGVLTPWTAGLLALVAIIAFAAGRENRTDPATAAGAGVVFGLFVFAISVLWAVTVPTEVPLQLTTNDPIVGPLTTAVIIENHRWVLSVAAAGPAVAGVWYTKALGFI